MDTIQVELLVKEMVATKVWQVKHIHPHRRLDDPDAKIFVSAGDRKSEVLLWVSEVRKSPPFQKVQRQLQGLIAQISDGKILERGSKAPQVEQGGRLSQWNVLTSFLRRLRPVPKNEGSKRVKSRSISLGKDLRQARETSER